MKAKLLLSALAGAMMSLAVTAPASLATEPQEKKILMVLWRGMTAWEKPFLAELEALGVKGQFTEVVGNQDRTVLVEAVRQQEAAIAAHEYDAIYSFGTTATQVTQSVVQDRIPIVFNIVFDPVGAKLVQSMEKPGVKTTGATLGVPIADQMDAFIALAPFKSLVLLFNAREANSNIIEGQVSDWASKHGIKLTSLRVAPTGDVLATTLAKITSGEIEADAVYAGADSFLGSKAGEIKAALGDKVMLFGGTQTFIKNGWLGAYTPTEEGMGKAAAGLMAKVLAGEDAATLPVILPTPKLAVSESAAAQHGVTVPAEAIAFP